MPRRRLLAGTSHGGPDFGNVAWAQTMIVACAQAAEKTPLEARLYET